MRTLGSEERAGDEAADEDDTRQPSHGAQGPPGSSGTTAKPITTMASTATGHPDDGRRVGRQSHRHGADGYDDGQQQPSAESGDAGRVSAAEIERTEPDGDDDEGDRRENGDAEERPAPVQELCHGTGQERADHRRHHPGGRERCKDPAVQVRR